MLAGTESLEPPEPSVIPAARPEPGSEDYWPVAAAPGGRATRGRVAAVAGAIDDAPAAAAAAAVDCALDGAAAGADAGDGEACGGSAGLAGRGAWPPPPPVSSTSFPLT